MRFWAAFLFFIVGGQAAAQPYVALFAGVGPANAEMDTAPKVAIGFPPCPNPFGCSFSAPINLQPRVDLTPVQSDLGISPAIGAAIGWTFNAPFPGRIRLEAEGTFRRARLGDKANFFACEPIVVLPQACLFDTEDAPSTDFVVVNARATSAMANFIYVGPRLLERLALYAGGGVGLAKTHHLVQTFETAIRFDDGIHVGVYSDERLKRTSFAWQAILGLAIDIESSLEVFAEGRYFATAGESEFVEDGFLASFVADQSASFEQLSGLAGVRWLF